MCKAPKAPKPKEPDKPEWLRNPYLDAATGQGGIVDQMRRGRSSLRTDMARGLGIRAAATPTPVSTHAPGLLPIDQPRPRRGGSGDIVSTYRF